MTFELRPTYQYVPSRHSCSFLQSARGREGHDLILPVFHHDSLCLSKMCFVSDNQGLTIGILVAILCLLAAGFVVYLKRKTLIRLLFTDKKTTIEKLRYAGFGSSFPETAFAINARATAPLLTLFSLAKKEVRFLDSKTVVLVF